jgi:hypothetical protein
LNLGVAQFIADRLQPRRIGAGEEAIVQRLEGDARLAQLVLHPFVAVEVELDPKGRVRTDLEERRPEVLILEVEVIVVDAHRLTGIVEADFGPRGPLLGLEGEGAFLGDADEDDPPGPGEALTVLGRNVILAHTPREVDDGDVVVFGEGTHRPNELVAHPRQEGGRGNRVTPMHGQEGDQGARHLEVGDVAIEVEPIQTLNVQRDVLLQEGVDCGHCSPFPPAIVARNIPRPWAAIYSAV